MAFNLSRSTRLYLSTASVDANKAAHTAANTFEVRVLTGYNFSQDTGSETITLNEAGDTPVRGQKVFNTQLNPADVSFITYIRPNITGAAHTCIERVLWEALVGKGNTAFLNTSPFLNTRSDNTSFKVDFENSDTHELMLLQAYFKLDNSTYQVKDLTIDSAEVSFDIEGIAQVVWSGKGIEIVADTPARADVATWVSGTNYLASLDTSNFIKNKLSTMTLTNNAGLVVANQTVSYASMSGTDAQGYNGTSTYLATINVDGTGAQTLSIDSATTTTVDDVIATMNDQILGANIVLDSTGTIVVTSLTHGTGGTVLIVDDAGANKAFAALSAGMTINAATAGSGTGTSYVIPITGGTLNITNNITFLTPESLGVVNTPIGSFTGARSISGSVTAYLRTGTTGSAQLLSDLVAATTTITHDFTMVLAAGGAANTPRAVFTLNHAHLVIPTVQVEDVVSVEISFTGLGQDIGLTDELNIEYTAV